MTEFKNGVLADVPMVVAGGAINSSTAADGLRAALDRLFKARYNVIFVDLAAVDSMDEEGRAVLHWAIEVLGKRGWLGLIGLTPAVEEALKSEGVLESPRIRVFKDRQAAIFVVGERAST